MAFEIERKYLVTSDSWRSQVDHSRSIKQAYFCNTDKASLRVRASDDKGFICTKSMTKEIRRHEFEYEIPLQDAEFMIENLCMGSSIIKYRHIVKIGEHTWEVDEFLGDNAGLLVAEIELSDEEESFIKPDWLGQEVSSEARYMNMSLVLNPFKDWTT